MCDGELHEGASGEHDGQHTPVGAAARTAMHDRRAAMPPPMGQPQPQLEQLRELEKKLEEERQQLMQQRAALERELRSRSDGGAARRRARDVHQRICDDGGGE